MITPNKIRVSDAVNVVRSGWAYSVMLACASLALASCGHSVVAQPAAPPPPLVLDAAAPVLATQLVASPVRSARAWSTALSPNPRGGWNFITQYFSVRSDQPSEYVVLDLETGKSTITPGRVGGYTNSNYQVSSQVRAKNGRIFFSEARSFITYYDPATESIKELGQVADPAIHTFVYRWAWGPDGKLYGGTQSSGKNPPVVVQIDPETLKHRVVGKVGVERNTPNYGYYLAVDNTPSEGAPEGWVYAAVGQNPWELVALNIATGEQKVLWKAADSWIDGFNTLLHGLRTGLVSNMSNADRKKEFFWVADGQKFPFIAANADTKIPFITRNTKPQGETGRPPGAPELDLSLLAADGDGVGRVLWRPAGSTGEFKESKIQIKHTIPVTLESLIALPDKTLLGNAVQYQGFFKIDPKSKKVTFFGAHGPSRGPRLVQDGKVYIAGYPKSVLYVYDPAKPWTSNRRMEELLAAAKPGEPTPAPLNPTKLGNFSATDAHYAYYLEPSKNGKIYFGGRRERSGTGGGIGWYDPKTKTFGGHHDGLSFLTPRGMKVMDDLGLVVYSGQVGKDPTRPNDTPTEAQLVFFDLDLKEVGRMSVRPGMKNTGLLLPGAKPGELIGLSEDENLAYILDVKNRKILAWKTLPTGGLNQSSFHKRPDGHLWGIMAGHLVRLNPANLEVQTLGKMGISLGNVTWVDNDMFGTNGPDVYQVMLPK